MDIRLYEVQCMSMFHMNGNSAANDPKIQIHQNSMKSFRCRARKAFHLASNFFHFSNSLPLARVLSLYSFLRWRLPLIFFLILFSTYFLLFRFTHAHTRNLCLCECERARGMFLFHFGGCELLFQIHIKRMLLAILVRLKNTLFIMVEETLVSNPMKLQAKEIKHK